MVAYLTTLESLIFQNKFVTTVLMEDISDLKFQLHRFNFEEYFIQQKEGNNFQHLCYYLQSF